MAAVFPEPYNAHTHTHSLKSCLERKAKAKCHQFVPNVFCLPFFLLCSGMASRLYFSFLFRYEAVFSQLESPSLLSMLSSTIKMGKISGTWELANKQFVFSLTYCVLIQLSSPFLSSLPHFSFFSLHFLLRLGVSLLKSRPKKPSVDI